MVPLVPRGAPGSRRVIYISPRGLCESIQPFLRLLSVQEQRKKRSERQGWRGSFLWPRCQSQSGAQRNSRETVCARQLRSR